MTAFATEHAVAAAALEVCDRVRNHNPLTTYRHYVAACARNPERMAQVLMALGAWIDPDTPVSVLGDRAEAAAANRAVPQPKPRMPR
ncbi:MULTISPECIES: hypothetical protein [unclassified Nocardia]|uniref:hypothetical protein n=1 Tax=unclassified Nocardia TaxID=2637762 RepID=UPI00278BD143|nr:MULTISPECIES: hypothetical protein [unclassified Nocardia]